MLRFDGLYVGPGRISGGDPVPYYDYLRFYADGWVINCVSSGRPDQVIRWFYRDNPEQSALLASPYDLSGDAIAFSPEFRDMDEGEEMLIKTAYEGCIIEGGDALDLKVGEARREEIYRFVRV